MYLPLPGRSGCVCGAACIGLLAAALPVGAAERIVLLEEFTATWCGPCENGGRAMSQLLDDYPDQIAAFQIHISDAYETSWCVTRANFYNVTAIPTVWVDGRLEHVGSSSTVQATYNDYLAMVQQRWATSSKFTLEVGGEPVAGDEYLISVRVGLQPDGVAQTVRVHIVQALDYYPAGLRHRNCVMQHPSFQVIDLVPDQTQVVTFPIQITGPSASDPDNIKVIAWVQRPVNHAPRTVRQAAVMNWPFTPLAEETVEGDVDGDGDVDLDDLTLLLGAYGTCDGDAEWDSNMDIDSSGCVDLDDLTLLLGNFGA